MLNAEGQRDLCPWHCRCRQQNEDLDVGEVDNLFAVERERATQNRKRETARDRERERETDYMCTIFPCEREREGGREGGRERERERARERERERDREKETERQRDRERATSAQALDSPAGLSRALVDSKGCFLLSLEGWVVRT